MESQKTVFSGIKPTGDLNIGHYLGAIKQWLKLQDNYQCLFCLVNLHALTIPENVKGKLRKQSYDLLALYLSLGLDPKRSQIFLQSDNYFHPYLAWILSCFVNMGQMNRMTQFKEKSVELKQKATLALFDYPVLMAADILLYDTDYVPVGQDQKQHVELARDIAERFNSFCQQNFFKLPLPLIQETGAKIRDLQNPSKKMSKSARESNGIIFILDTKENIYRKIRKAVTDSENQIYYQPEKKPGISNLIEIYSGFTNLSIKDIEKKYQGISYDAFKNDLADIIWGFLKEIQQKYQENIQNIKLLNEILDEGLEYSLNIAQKKTNEVKKILGLQRN